MLKNPKITNQNDPENMQLETSTVTLKLQDKIHIEGKELLNDRIIGAAHKIMKTQFTDPLINGFQTTLFKGNVTHSEQIDKDMVQILHRGRSGSGHWFTVSTIGCQEGSINVYDSIYNDIDQESKVQICSILKYMGKSLKFTSFQFNAGQGPIVVDFYSFRSCLVFWTKSSKVNFQRKENE